VVYINHETGNAEIIDEEGEKEVFVHLNGLIDEINEGDKVEFEIEEGPKGLNAVNVKVV
jgi:CspA family cold shock protein